MEPTTPNKDQDPPHGGSWLRQADGSLTLVEGQRPEGSPIETTPASDPPAATAQE